MKYQSTLRMCAISAIAIFLQMGCGQEPTDSPSEAQPVCTEEELAQPADDCKISGHYQIEEPEDLRPFCESSCANGDELFIQVEGPVQTLKPLSRFSRILRIDIHEGSELESLEGLENLEWVKNITIEDTKHLRDLEGLDSLHTVENDMIIQFNESLTSTSGATALEEAGALGISGNWELDDLQFESLTKLDALLVTGNESLPACQVDELANQIEDLKTMDNNGNASGSCE